jgi:hypothetical protein
LHAEAVVQPPYPHELPVTILQWWPIWWIGSSLWWYTRTEVLVAQLAAPLCRSFEVSVPC